MLKRLRLVVPVLLVLLSGCASLGPEAIRQSRGQFNEAIRDSDAQEMLVNLLRMRYVEPLSFGAITQIQYAREQTQSLGLGGGLTGAHTSPAGTDVLTRTLTLGPGSMAINDKPVISYTPLQGDKFVMSLMTPMQLNLLLLEVKSGWNVSRVFKIGVDQINGLRNSVTAVEPDDGFVAFNRAVELLSDLRDRRMADFAVQNGKPELRFVAAARDDAAALEFRRLLRLDPTLDAYELLNGSAEPNARQIVISPRSLMSALFYLSHGIRTPADDVQQGRVSGKAPPEWTRRIGEIFTVESSVKAPDDAAVAVNYRKRWFFVRDSDLSSKSSFVLLGQLYALHSVPPSSTAVQINSF